MHLDVTVDITGALAKLQRVRTDQLPFAMAKALNDVAGMIQAATPAVLERHLDRPTDFTKSPKGMYTRRADRRASKLVVFVGFKARQSEYLRYQFEGGVRRPKRLALRLPVEQPLDAHGNLPAKTISTLVKRAQAGRRLTKRQGQRLRVSSKVDLFYGDPGDGRAAGIYKRLAKDGEGRNRLIPLILFRQTSARYEARVPWHNEAHGIARRHIAPAFRDAFALAMRTAR